MFSKKPLRILVVKVYKERPLELRGGSLVIVPLDNKEQTIRQWRAAATAKAR